MVTIVWIESGFKVPNSDDLAFDLHYLCIRKFFEMNAMTPYNGAHFNTKRINTRQKKAKRHHDKFERWKWKNRPPTGQIKATTIENIYIYGIKKNWRTDTQTRRLNVKNALKEQIMVVNKLIDDLTTRQECSVYLK